MVSEFWQWASWFQIEAGFQISFSKENWSLTKRVLTLGRTSCNLKLGIWKTTLNVWNWRWINFIIIAASITFSSFLLPACNRAERRGRIHVAYSGWNSTFSNVMVQRLNNWWWRSWGHLFKLYRTNPCQITNNQNVTLDKFWIWSQIFGFWGICGQNGTNCVQWNVRIHWESLVNCFECIFFHFWRKIQPFYSLLAFQSQFPADWAF